MRKILTAAEMKAADQNTIENHGIPSLVLMERAALAVVSTMRKNSLLAGNILCICGTGNNGADGVAIARILHLKKKKATILLVGDSSKNTPELIRQLEIANSYGVRIERYENVDESTYFNGFSTIVDAIFGIGLKREVTGDFLEVIEAVNASNAKVIAVDMPSGYSTDTGALLGAGIKADYTVTFSYKKKGLSLSECYKNSGEVVIKDVGIKCENGCSCHEITKADLKAIPRRKKDANKGSLGKLLVVAGSKDVYGACFLSALAAQRMGAGYVRIYTHVNNSSTLQDKLPEAVVITYDENHEKLLQAISWADAVLIGPGIGTDDNSKKMLETVLLKSDKPVVIDADGINLMAQNPDVYQGLIGDYEDKKRPVIITPHLLEMSRLCGQTVSEISDNMEEVARAFSTEYGITVLLKNYTSLITNGKKVIINSTGDEALATAGSGDVLAGIVAALLSFGVGPLKAAALGAYIHGKAGKAATESLSSKNILASEIANAICKVIS